MVRSRKPQRPSPVPASTAAPQRTKLSRRRWLGLTVSGLLGAAAVGAWLVLRNPSGSGPVRDYTFEIVQRYPHDEHAFTQGLIWSDGFLYEGTGQYGQSQLRKLELTTGRVLQAADLPAHYFGEGITLWRDTLIQLTWESGVALVYDRNTLRQLREISYPEDILQGWGLTHDDTHLILSDGSNKLWFLHPETFQIEKTIEVQAGGRAVWNLNELEYIAGEIYANVWHSDEIVRISPQTGAVVGRLDLTGLRPVSTYTDPEKVPNGIAYDPQGQRLFVTGKNWPTLFEIRLLPR